MGMHTARSRLGEPGHDLALSLGRLLVSSAQLRNLHDAVVSGERDEAAHAEAIAGWAGLARHMLALHDRIVASAAIMHFSGSTAEHLIISDGAVRIPADAQYVATLSRRMDRHARLGRVIVETWVPEESIAV